MDCEITRQLRRGNLRRAGGCKKPRLHVAFRRVCQGCGRPHTAGGFRFRLDATRFPCPARRKPRRGGKSRNSDSALDCIVAIDHEGCITEFNPAAERTFGRRRGDVIGKRLADIIIPPSLRERHKLGLARYLATGESRVIGTRIEQTALRSDGSEFPVELAITRIDQDGLPSFIGYLRDITERKQAEEKLRRSEAFLSEAQHLSSTGSFSWRVETDEIAWSEQLYRIFEVEPGTRVTFDLIGARVHPDDKPLLFEMIDRGRGAVNDFEYEHRLLMPNHAVKYVHLIACGVRDRKGRLEYIGAAQDVTQRRLSDEALAKVRSELSHVARVTSLGVLTASIAHEVNQPLGSIIINAETALRWLARPDIDVEKLRDLTRRVVVDARRASDIIERIRAMATRRAPQRTLLSIDDIVEELVAFLRHEFQSKGISVSLDLAPALPKVVGDRTANSTGDREPGHKCSPGDGEGGGRASEPHRSNRAVRPGNRVLHDRGQRSRT